MALDSAPPASTSLSSGGQAAGTLVTLALASSVAVGSNFVDVKKGEVTPSFAVANGLVKGVTATVILRQLRPTTPLRIAGAVGLLAGAGYCIDSMMKTRVSQGEEEGAP